MFVKIVTKISEYTYDCDGYRIDFTKDEPPSDTYNVFITILKNKIDVVTHDVEKTKGNAIYIMNDAGRTVDSYCW